MSEITHIYIDYNIRKKNMRLTRRLLSSLSTSFSDVRVRFAPSPTGHLHLGGLRTALYNFLFAKKYGGAFILRIEDTDQTRVVPGALEALIRDLQWSGLTIDEGPGVIGGSVGPYIQSERVSLYRDKNEELIERGGAYRCFCTEHRLDLLRKDVARRGEYFRGYDNRCRHLSRAEVDARVRDDVTHVTRLILNDEITFFDDMIFGPSSDNLSQREGDPILLKTDGYPTYHLANVVDDHLMRVTHVLRGAEWLSSTPKHLRIYQAFDWTPPRFCHIPLIMNSDGKKLSKRNESLRVSSLRSSGFSPETLLTFLCSVGGGILPHHEKTDGEYRVHQLQELVDSFDVDQLSRSRGSLNFDHLNHYSRNHYKTLLDSRAGRDRLLRSFKQLVTDSFDPATLDDISDEKIESILDWSVDRVVTLKELVVDENVNFAWVSPKYQFDLIARIVVNTTVDEVSRLMEDVKTRIVANKNTSTINKELQPLTKKRHEGISFKDLMKLVRWSLIGGLEGAPVAEIVEIIGREKACRRIDDALEYLSKEVDEESRGWKRADV